MRMRIGRTEEWLATQEDTTAHYSPTPSTPCLPPSQSSTPVRQTNVKTNLDYSPLFDTVLIERGDTMSDNLIVANTILQQLGGNKFIAMTGAKNLGADGNTLSFRFPSRSGANHCRITLNSLDLYDMQFIRIRKVKGIPQSNVTAEHNGIYADQLQTIFTKETGLYTSL
jgi:hypothetical protein